MYRVADDYEQLAKHAEKRLRERGTPQDRCRASPARQSCGRLSEKTVVLDLVQPLAARRQLIGFGRKARRDESGREGAHTQHNVHS